MRQALLKRSIALMISAAMMAVMMLPVLPVCDEAYAAGSTLDEIARQLSEEDDDPFRTDDGSAGIGIEEQADYPSSYDLRDVDTNGDGKGDTSFVTPVKFQNPFGSCWGFAAISAAETSILGNPETRENFVADLSKESDKTGKLQMALSEKHLVWFAYQPINDSSHLQDGEGFKTKNSLTSSATFNIGGKPFYATSLFASGMGPAMEYVKQAVNGEFEYHGKKSLVESTDGDVYRESKFPSKKTKYCYSSRDDWSIDSRWRFFQSYSLKASYLLPTPAGKTGTAWQSAINGIKEQLMANRGVEIAFCADAARPVSSKGKLQNTKYISNYWAHYTYDNVSANHSVAIIGWDDNYPKENFSHKISGKSDAEAAKLSTPEHDGAWLVKNSWGAETESFPNKGPGNWGLLEGQDKAPYQAKSGAKHTGYFWISYDDKSVTMVEALDFDISNIRSYYLCYQHDYMPVNEARAAETDGAVSMANIFESELENYLGQVTFQTIRSDTDVNIKVYVLNDGAVSPTDGTLVSETNEKCKYGGLHVVNIAEGVVVPRGKKFSVVITQKTSGGKYCYNLQYSLNKNGAAENNKKYYAVSVINKGESMLYTDGSWKDLSDASLRKTLLGSLYSSYSMDNFPIKVYAADETDPDRADQMGEDGSPFGKGASDDAAYNAAVSCKSNKDLQGTAYAGLRLRSESQTSAAVKLKWDAPEGAARYMIYGAPSGSSNYLKLVKAVDADEGTALNVTKIRSSKLRKGTYYKFMVVALDSDWNVLTTSKMIHVATKGGKVKNYTKIKLSKPAKARLSLKEGGTYTIKAKAVGKKVSKKIGLRYESTDSTVAAVSSKGRISAKTAGSCTILVYMQSGRYRAINVTVS